MYLRLINTHHGQPNIDNSPHLTARGQSRFSHLKQSDSMQGCFQTTIPLEVVQQKPTKSGGSWRTDLVGGTSRSTRVSLEKMVDAVDLHNRPLLRKVLLENVNC